MRNLISSYRVWLALGISVAFMGLFLSRTDLSEMVIHMGSANYTLLPPALIVYSVAVYFRARRWQYLLSPIKVIPVRRLYPVVVVGYMANNIFPARLGEIFRAYYLGKREQVNNISSLTTIVVERVFDGLTLLFFIAIASMFLPMLGLLAGLADRFGTSWTVLTALMSLPFIGLATLMVVFSVSPSWLTTLSHLAKLAMPIRLWNRTTLIVQPLITGLAVMKSPRSLLSVFLLSTPVWLSEALMYYILAFSFGLDRVFTLSELAWMMIIVTAIANLFTSLPAAGGGIGTYEVAAATTLGLLGTEQNTASAYTIVLHASLIVPVTLAGLVCLWADSTSLRQLAQVGTGQNKQAGPSEIDEHPDRRDSQ